MTESHCGRCKQWLSTDDTITFDVDHIIHLDCQRPHQLNNEERALLFTFCWDHPVAQCAACCQSFRQHQLAADLFGHHSHLCPRCRTDLTANLREHLFACAVVPTEVRWKAEDARNATRRLIRLQRQLSQQVAVLMRDVDSAIGALRDAIDRVASRTAERA